MTHSSKMAKVATASALCATLGACSGTTGFELVDLRAELQGPALEADGTARVVTDAGWTVTLTELRVHVGALYLNRTLPQVGIQETACTLPGTYVGQVTDGFEADLLAGEAVPFPSLGQAIRAPARAGEVWLTGVAVDAEFDSTHVLTLAGVAEREADTIPFDGVVTIGPNRRVPPEDPLVQPGANPICKQRIVSPIPVDLVPSDEGSLLVTFDPAGLLREVDFAQLPEAQSAPPLHRFPDALEGQPAIALFQGLRATQGTWRFSWAD